MKLDRNTNGRGKYALLKLRRIEQVQNDKDVGRFAAQERLRHALSVLEEVGAIDWGLPKTESEFFVIKLRDCHAEGALWTYATSVLHTDVEYGDEIAALAERSGTHSPFCKLPD